ncbi:MAG TPA: hypothetical protein VJI67_03735, partial [archaeon]|nr:hypothetical protein [archaeon]
FAPKEVNVNVQLVDVENQPVLGATMSFFGVDLGKPLATCSSSDCLLRLSSGSYTVKISAPAFSKTAIVKTLNVTPESSTALVTIEQDIGVSVSAPQKIIRAPVESATRIALVLKNGSTEERTVSLIAEGYPVEVGAAVKYYLNEVEAIEFVLSPGESKQVIASLVLPASALVSGEEAPEKQVIFRVKGTSSSEAVSLNVVEGIKIALSSNALNFSPTYNTTSDGELRLLNQSQAPVENVKIELKSADTASEEVVEWVNLSAKNIQELKPGIEVPVTITIRPPSPEAFLGEPAQVFKLELKASHLQSGWAQIVPMTISFTPAPFKLGLPTTLSVAIEQGKNGIIQGSMTNLSGVTAVVTPGFGECAKKTDYKITTTLTNKNLEPNDTVDFFVSADLPKNAAVRTEFCNILFTYKTLSGSVEKSQGVTLTILVQQSTETPTQ